MNRKLILIAVAMLGVLGANVSEAKVCRLGDADCGISDFYGSGNPTCSSEYITCPEPRIGATYCKEIDGDGNVTVKYAPKDCCSSLGYEECSDKWEAGRGDSCRTFNGAGKAVTYWQQCGCQYGFAETDDEGNFYRQDVSYSQTCGTFVHGDRCMGIDVGSDRCKFISCNVDRRFVGESRSYCKYRLDTSCGSFGCRQVYDCDNDAEYYRNDSEYLSSGNKNFIDHRGSDVLSNELDASGNLLPSVSYNDDCSVNSQEYNIVNRYVCNYLQSDGNYTEDQDKGIKDVELGFDCGEGVPNYCYLWKGCNNTRRWFNSDLNVGVLYSENLYPKWFSVVENASGYDYNGMYPIINPKHHEFLKLESVNPNYDKYEEIEPGYDSEGNPVFSYNGKSLSVCNNAELTVGEGGSTGDIYTSDLNTSTICYIVNKDNGCAYIRKDCHQDDNGHRCWKKIGCANENRFYSSFINAAVKGYIDDATALSDNAWYATSVNTSFYYDVYYNGLEAKEIYPACLYRMNNCNDDSGCFRKEGCAEGFEDIRDHTEIETDWETWFEDIRPICNDSTRCYKAISCTLETGAYSSVPNTSFFVTINSLATGLICYKGVECRIDAGSYTSTPNTSFFITINSLSSASTCYRGQECHSASGAYTSAPNNFFFSVQKSISSGSTCYRGVYCLGLDEGAYTSSPNTSFFEIISSHASSSSCFRGQNCSPDAGSYTSTPNTSFFITINSLSSGSICYRGQECHITAGAYTSTPNTLFFEVQESLSSGSTCYRGTKCRFETGIYTSTPNTSFFLILNSHASGSNCYRSEGCHFAAGAYASAPNTSFFVTIHSLSTNSYCYRGQECYVDAGSYTSTPNTSFFITINSLSSASTCYRGQECYIDGGAYTSTPNEYFFYVQESLSSGSTCYRGVSCSGLDGGAYTSTPNTSFFEVIYSLASGSSCYRGQNCSPDSGAYTSTPNTSFFITINSLSSASTCYRGQECHIDSGSYTSTPNTSFFITINSLASSSTCYRGQECNIDGGAYTSTPNTVFFDVINSLSSASTCYRGEICAETSNDFENTSFFNMVFSLSSGSTCYRASGCNIEAGAYTSEPNTSFFVLDINTNAKDDSTCYRGQDCHIAAGAYTSTPNTSFFVTNHSLASGSTAYRAEASHITAGAYTSTPNTSYFITIHSLASGSTAYRGQDSNLAAGAYTSEPNTSYFITIHSLASGSTAYRAEMVCIDCGSYSSSPNILFFSVVSSHASGSISYRSEDSHITNGAYTSTPNTSFFITIRSLSSGSTAYRGESAHVAAGAYTSTPNTMFFDVIKSLASGSTSYRAEKTHITNGAYTSTPNTSFFVTSYSLASGSTSYRGESAHIAAGAYANEPNTMFFNTVYSLASSLKVYRTEKVCIECGSYSSEPNTSFFLNDYSLGSGSTSYRGREVHIDAGAYNNPPNTSFFITIHSLATGLTVYRAESVNIAAGAYTSTPNHAFFNIDYSLGSGSKCYRGRRCASTAVVEANLNTLYFVYNYSLSSGSTCYRSSACREEVGAYSSGPNTSFFNILSSTNAEQDSTCYRGQDCHIEAGAYTSTPNTSYFITISSLSSGSTAYRAESVNIDAGAYTSVPNTLFFVTVYSLASGSTSYRAVAGTPQTYTSSPNTSFFITITSHASSLERYRGESAHITAGAYETTPNITFFNVIQSSASGSISYRAEKVCVECGSYSSEPNTSFFATSFSLGSGSKSYRGEGAQIDAGAYASEPNTMFFNTIYSLASGLKMYRAESVCIDCGSYTSEPNTSFFSIDYSLGSGSTSYRGREVHIDAGAYTSTPNTIFFKTVSSHASGSIVYRAYEANVDEGSYAEKPNEIFFTYVYSHASGSISYRAGGISAYTSSPNTSFFEVVSSSATGLVGWQATSIHYRAGAYSTAPNAVYFNTISSQASGYTSYRAESVNITAGSYTSTPNTSFFVTSHSLASGSTSYRGEGAHVSAGAYATTPNIIFFNTISSHASGTPAFRAESVNITAGSYSSSPNTSFFVTSYSLGSGSTSYRAETINIDAGAYLSEPNTVFFNITSSHASGIPSFRAEKVCVECGSYSSEPNTVFFNVDYSLGSGSKSYRVSGSADGAYSSSPNTSFFEVISSTASGLTSWISSSIHYRAGAYRSAPNDTFFNIISSHASGTPSFRAESVNITAGSYTSEPNTSFFITSFSLGSGSTSYRAESINIDAGAYETAPNTAFFITISSQATGIECFRAEGCKTTAGASDKRTDEVYDEANFFVQSTSLASGTTCYRVDACNEDYYSYAQEDTSPYVLYRNKTAEQHGGLTCYKGTACNEDTGYKAPEKVNTSYFAELSSVQYDDGKFCQLGRLCNLDAGAYSVEPYTSFFVTSSETSGENNTETCFRAEGCNIDAGAYASEPNMSFFGYAYLEASGIRCYRSFGCRERDDISYSIPPVASFFITSHSYSSGSECFRAEGCNTGAGSYSSEPNTLYFIANENTKSGITCYRADSGCSINAGAYSSSPNTSFFIPAVSHASGATCYRAKECNTENFATTTIPDAAYFTYVSSKASGTTCYRVTDCAPTVHNVNNLGGFRGSTVLFRTSLKAENNNQVTCQKITCQTGFYSSTINYKDGEGKSIVTTDAKGSGPYSGNVVCYWADSCDADNGYAEGSSDGTGFVDSLYFRPPNSSFYSFSKYNEGDDSRNEILCQRVSDCADGTFTSIPDGVSRYFVFGSKSYRFNNTLQTCYRALGCPNTSEFSLDEEHADTSYFRFATSTASGITCYLGIGCASSAHSEKPNTSFFKISNKANQGQDRYTTCYRGESCNIEAGSYTSEPNTTFFKVGSSKASGLTCFRASGCNTSVANVVSASTQNTSGFITVGEDQASGYKCKKVECDLTGGYSEQPGTSYFSYNYNTMNELNCYWANGCNPYFYNLNDATYGKVLGSYSSNELNRTDYITNISAFVTQQVKDGSQTCYLITGCANGYENIKYYEKPYHSKVGGYLYYHQARTGANCYQSTGCDYYAGALTTKPDTSFFNYDTQTMTSGIDSVRECYKATSCASTAMSSQPSTSFFVVIEDNAYNTATPCYRAIDCNRDNGAYPLGEIVPESVPGMFTMEPVGATGVACNYMSGCGEGFYSSSPNTSFFYGKSGRAGSLTCYYGGGCHIEAGAYTSAPNATFFKVDSSLATGRTCYRSRECNSNASTSRPDPNYFEFISSKSSGFTCYRGTECKSENGSYEYYNLTDTVLELFNTSTIYAAPKTCYFGSSCNTNNKGVYQVGTKTVNTNIYTISASAQNPDGLGCAKAVCNTSNGFVDNDNSSYWFDYGNSYSFNSGKSNNFVCYKINGCNTTGNLIVDANTFSAYNSSGFSTSGYSVTSKTAGGVSCYESTSCNTGYNYVAITTAPTSRFFVSDAFEYDSMDRPHWKSQFFCAFATGCNTDVAESNYDPLYHEVTTVEAYNSDGLKEVCYKPKPTDYCASGASSSFAHPGKPCKYNSTSGYECCVHTSASVQGNLTSCVDVSTQFKILGGKKCIRPKCSAVSTQLGVYTEGCSNTSYFSSKMSRTIEHRNGYEFTISGDFIQAFEFETVSLKCLTNNPADNLQTCAVNANDISNNVVKSTNADYNDYKYYTFGSASAKCSTTTARKVNGCNNNLLSYDSSYLSLSNATITLSTGASTSASDAGVSSYTDIFTIATPLQAGLSDTDCATCYVACGCNEANGWTSTQPSGAYHKAVSKIKYNYKVTGNISRSTSSTGTKDLISEGTSRAYSVSTTATGGAYSVSSSSNFEPTCYKQKGNYYDCDYKWNIVNVNNQYDEYVLSELVCTNRNDSTDKVTYNATSNPTLRQVLDSAESVDASGSKANFGITLYYTLIAFDEQAQYHPTSTLVPSKYRGAMISWEDTATKGLFTKYDQLSAYVTLEEVSLVYDSKANGYVMKINKNANYETNVKILQHRENGKISTILQGSYDRDSDTTRKNTPFENAYLYMNGVTVGEYATRNLISSERRFTTLGNSDIWAYTLNGKKPEVVNIFFDGTGDDDPLYEGWFGVPEIKYNGNILYRKGITTIWTDSTGSTITHIDNPSITRKSDTNLYDRMFRLDKDVKMHLYATYRADSSGAMGRVIGVGAINECASHYSIVPSGEETTTEFYENGLPVTLEDTGSWVSAKQVLSHEKYKFNDVSGHSHYLYHKLCDGSEGESMGFWGGHHLGISHANIVNYCRCDTEEGIYGDIYMNGNYTDLDMFIQAVDSSGQPIEGKYYYAKGNNAPEAEVCPGQYYSELDNISLDPASYPGINVEKDGQCYDVTCSSGYTKYTQSTSGSTIPSDCKLEEYGSTIDTALYGVSCSNSDRYGYAFKFKDKGDVVACLNNESCPSGSNYYNISMGLNYRCDFGGGAIATPYVKTSGNITDVTVDVTGTAKYGSTYFSDINITNNDDYSTMINPDYHTVTWSDSTKLEPTFTSAEVTYMDERYKWHYLDLMKYTKNEFYIPEENLCIKLNKDASSDKQLEVPTISLPYCFLDNTDRINCKVNIHFETDNYLTTYGDGYSGVIKTSITGETYVRNLSPNVIEPHHNINQWMDDNTNLVAGLQKFLEIYKVRNSLNPKDGNAYPNSLIFLATVKVGTSYKYGYLYVDSYGNTCGAGENEGSTTCNNIETAIKNYDSAITSSNLVYKWNKKYGYTSSVEKTGSKVEIIRMLVPEPTRLDFALELSTSQIDSKTGKYKNRCTSGACGTMARSTCDATTKYLGDGGAHIRFKHGTKSDGLSGINCPDGYFAAGSLSSADFTKFENTFTYTFYTTTSGSDGCVRATGCAITNGYYSDIVYSNGEISAFPNYYTAFDIEEETSGDITCYKATCNNSNNYYDTCDGDVCLSRYIGLSDTNEAGYIHSDIQECFFNASAIIDEPTCSSFISSLKCGDEYCDTNKHYVFHVNKIPGGFMAASTSAPSCYAYFMRSGTSCSYFGNNASDELQCTSGIPGPTPGQTYEFDGYTTIYDIYGKSLEYESYSMDSKDIVYPDLDRPFEDLGGGDDGIISFDPTIKDPFQTMIKQSYNKMCGLSC